jgi:hypothetical protein
VRKRSRSVFPSVPPPFLVLSGIPKPCRLLQTGKHPHAFVLKEYKENKQLWCSQAGPTTVVRKLMGSNVHRSHPCDGHLSLPFSLKSTAPSRPQPFSRYVRCFLHCCCFDYRPSFHFVRVCASPLLLPSHVAKTERQRSFSRKEGGKELRLASVFSCVCEFPGWLIGGFCSASCTLPRKPSLRNTQCCT